MFSLSRTALPLLATTLAASASAATLTIVAEGVQGRRGVMRAAMFRDTTDQLKPDSAVRADITALDSVSGGNVTFVYADLPAGCHVLPASHDANNDGKLSTNPADIPTEPHGFGRDACSRFDPSVFDDAVIDVQGDQRMTIHLH